MTKRPREKLDWLAAEASYSAAPPQILQDGDERFDLVLSTPTIKAYRSGNRILVALRGTVVSDRADLAADASIAINRLAYSDRVKRDEEIMRGLFRRFPPSSGFVYYAVGHSLGGAELLVMMRKYPAIVGAVAYNSALQPQDVVWQPSASVDEIYQARDPLFQLMGRFLRRKRVYADGAPATATDEAEAAGLPFHSLARFGSLYQSK